MVSYIYKIMCLQVQMCVYVCVINVWYVYQHYQFYQVSMTNFSQVATSSHLILLALTHFQIYVSELNMFISLWWYRKALNLTLTCYSLCCIDLSISRPEN